MIDYGRNVANADQVRKWATELRDERALTDAFAHATAFLFVHGDESELDAVLARYRETRQQHG